MDDKFSEYNPPAEVPTVTKIPIISYVLLVLAALPLSDIIARHIVGALLSGSNTNGYTGLAFGMMGLLFLIPVIICLLIWGGTHLLKQAPAQITVLYGIIAVLGISFEATDMLQWHQAGQEARTKLQQFEKAEADKKAELCEPDNMVKPVEYKAEIKAIDLKARSITARNLGSDQVFKHKLCPRSKAYQLTDKAPADISKITSGDFVWISRNDGSDGYARIYVTSDSVKRRQAQKDYAAGHGGNCEDVNVKEDQPEVAHYHSKTIANLTMRDAQSDFPGLQTPVYETYIQSLDETTYICNNADITNASGQRVSPTSFKTDDWIEFTVKGQWLVQFRQTSPPTP